MKKLGIFIFISIISIIDIWAIPQQKKIIDSKDAYAKGTLTRANGDIYIGNLINGRPNGKGTLSRANGYTYVGDFVNGRPNGNGTFTWNNGSKYEGNFTDGRPSGLGTYYNADGRSIRR